MVILPSSLPWASTTGAEGLVAGVGGDEVGIGHGATRVGPALGYQLIAEGKSNMSKENYHRFQGL